MANKSETTITKTKAVEFIDSSKSMNELSCEKITGFHLVRTKTGATWRLRYTDFAGKRRKINLGRFVDGVHDRTLAIETAKKYRVELSAGIDPAQERDKKRDTFKKHALSRKNRLLGAYLDNQYTEHQSFKKNEGKHTIDMIRRAFFGFLDKPMNEISEENMQDWEKQYRVDINGNKRSQATIERSYGAFKTMLNHAISKGIIDTMPLGKFKLTGETSAEKDKKHDGSQQKTRRMLTKEELMKINLGFKLYKQKMIDARESSRSHGKSHLPSLKTLSYPHWFFPFMRIAHYSGFRVGDLYSLNWMELNLQTRRLIKFPSKTRHHKSPARVDLSLDDSIYEVCKSWHEQNGSPSHGYVFPSATGEMMSKKAHVTHWKKVLLLGGITEQLDFYALRHHYISKMVSGGIPLLTIAKLAGHKSADMIEQHYHHLAPNDTKKALALLSGDFA